MNLDQISWQEKLNNDNSPVILDVRTEEEYEEKHIPGSVNINFYDPSNFISEINKLDKSKSYYIYCRTGVRSENSCILMLELGFNKLYNLVGGIQEWKGKTIN